MNESRMPERRSPEDDRLDALFAAYRSAFEPVEVSVNFMPELWQKIDRVQSRTFSFRRIARGFLSAATALSIAMATLVVMPAWHAASPVYSATYVETLAADSDTLETVDVTLPDSAEEPEEI